MKAMKLLKIMGIVLLSSSACFGADEVYSPVANLTEKWTNDAQWASMGDGTPALIEQSMCLLYSNSASANGDSLPFTIMGAIDATSLSSGGRFVGNYSNSAITHVSFDVMAIHLVADATFSFVSENGNVWNYSFRVPTQVGVWERREIPMTYSSQWTGNVASVQAFEKDRSKISMILVTSSTQRKTSQIRIDNFKVVGPWEKGPTIDGEMPLAWLMENSSPNLLVEAGQGGLDADGDGFSNYAEYIAGTGPNDANSQFKIEIGQDVDGKPVVTWKHENYRNYKVFKSSDLTLNGSFKEETGTIQTVGAKNQMPVSEGAAGAAFYRVEVDKQ